MDIEFDINSELRNLFEDEMNDILSIIKIDNLVPYDVSFNICENLRNDLKKQLKGIKIFPENIPILKNKIELEYHRSKIQPGEMIGCLAASSIGEQNTQASLNSFHSAGIMKANLTSGVVRLTELLNASKQIKTPSTTIYLNPELVNVKDLYTVKMIAESNFKYYDIESAIIKYDIAYNRKLTTYEKKYYSFFNMFYNYKLDDKWCIRLYFNPDVLYRIKKSLEHISKCINNSFKDIFCVFFPDNKFIIDVWVDTDITDPMVVFQNFKKDCKDLDLDDNDYYNNYMKSINNENKEFFYLKNIVCPNLLTIKISGIDNIEECYYTDNKYGEWYIDTKGSNFKQVIINELVDFKRTTSNNMWEIYEVLGITACKDFLKFEFKKIIEKVNERHLDILVSAMINNGVIRSVSRYGIDRAEAGILAKIAFEQPFDNFFIAANKAEKDTLEGVSASVTTGKVGKMGTGYFDILLDLNKLGVSDKLLVSKKPKPFKNTKINKSNVKSRIFKLDKGVVEKEDEEEELSANEEDNIEVDENTILANSEFNEEGQSDEGDIEEEEEEELEEEEEEYFDDDFDNFDMDDISGF